MIQTLPITKARQNLPSLVNKAQTKFDEYIITVKGFPAAALISASEYESWKETNEIMSDAGLVKAIARGEKEIDEGKWLDWEDVKNDLNINV